MPIYEYRCTKCGHQEEFLQKASEPALSKCPACGKSTFQKLLSAAGFQLKGTGWYATDFRGGGAKSSEKKSEKKTESKPESKTSGSKSDGKSDSKPDSKPESKAAA